MAKIFTKNEWRKIHAELDRNESEYGLPERDDKSILIASWNIRKFGKIDEKKRDNDHFLFISKVVKRFDLISVQEVMDDLSSIKKLRDLINKDISKPEERYGLVLSDITGDIPGGPGLQERLAFLYKRNRVRRTEIASDISVDRGPVLRKLRNLAGDYIGALVDLISEHEEKRAKYFEWGKVWAKLGKRPKPPSAPKLHFADFLTFVRSPYLVSFQLGVKSANPYEIMAVGAHLVFGTPEQRAKEFSALLEWLSSRLEKPGRAYYPNFLLMGDLNLDLDTEDDRLDTDKYIKELARSIGSGKRKNQVDIYFPFITPYPSPGERFTLRSNVKLSQTYDQIGFFTVDKRMPKSENRNVLGRPGSLEDYGVFNFTKLFAKAIINKSYDKLSERNKDALIRRFHNTVSDHMPIWVRLKMPA
ncbi:MAG: endonuclease/exonuclease/phosphatase [Candidatus Marinimicrobia bacterium]|nr:endonuclease/exonuclease/phosphatase [Candidatus Neomarinimicrobiota bacterium]